jgi:S-adenosylmethionine synthetase
MKIKNIKKIEKEKTYDLSIGGNHNYFVGKSEILVHNSGKDPSKVDRSAAYAARHIAKNLVAAGLCREVLVQVSYAIGVAKPTSINVNTYNTSRIQMTDGEISEAVEKIFDMTPYAIEKRLKLRNPIYSETASYGHMGRQPETKTKIFMKGNQPIVKEVELFTWEKLDYVEKVKKAFKLK